MHLQQTKTDRRRNNSLADRTSQTDDERIKDITVLPPPDHLIRFFPIRGTAVSTGNFASHINRTANDPDFPFYQDSVDVGPPGRLTTCYVGYKALLHLTPGRHLLRVDLSAAGSVLTYRLDVEDD